MSSQLLRRKISEKKLMLRRALGTRCSTELPTVCKHQIFFRSTDFAEKEGLLVVTNSNENKVLLDYSRANQNIRCFLLFLLLGINGCVPIIQNLCNHGNVEYGRKGENSQNVLVPSLLHCSEDTGRVGKQ